MFCPWCLRSWHGHCTGDGCACYCNQPDQVDSRHPAGQYSADLRHMLRTCDPVAEAEFILAQEAES